MTKQEYNRNHYLKHRDKIRAGSRNYYWNHREVMQEFGRSNYKKNRVHILAQKKEYASRTKEKRSNYNKDYRKKNEYSLRVRQSEYKKTHRLEVNARNRAYWDKNPEKFKNWQRNWASKNRGKLNSYGSKRRAMELKATIDPEAAKWFYEIVHNQDFLTCAYCLKTITPKQAHVDHIIPITRGGIHGPDNFCVACGSCNQSKCDWLLSEWKKCPERIKNLNLN